MATDREQVSEGESQEDAAGTHAHLVGGGSDYGADKIRVLQGLEAVRKRPSENHLDKTEGSAKFSIFNWQKGNILNCSDTTARGILNIELNVVIVCS